jgi:ATP-dependent helicase/nuclease subunit A
VQEALPAAAQARLQRLRRALDTSMQEGLQTYATAREGLARRVESAWLRLGGPAACAAAADLTHARAFFDALAQWSLEPDWNGPQELPHRLGRLFATHSAHGAQAVQVMTIHRAKGLEFDHVILPGLGRKRRGSERELLQWLDLPRGTSGRDLLMVAVPPAAAAGPTALGRYVTRLQDQRAQNEATRLLYVAATRARHQLHLYGELDVTPRAGTLLARLWPAIKAQFPVQAQDSESTAAPQAAEIVREALVLERLSQDWTVPPLPPGPQAPGLPIASYEAAPLQHAVNLSERAVCELLRSQARRRRLPAGDDAALAQLLRARLERLGCAPEELPDRTMLALGLLQACLNDARLQWIFASLAAADAQAESPLALTGLVAGRLTSTRADLSFKDAAGTRWLIDIAPQPAADLTLESAFGARVARHVHLAQGLESDVAARAAVYVPARQLFWTMRD